MKKSGFSKFLVFMLIICLACSILLLAACNNGSDHQNTANKTDKDNQVVANGDFTFAEGDEYPRTPTAWSGAIGGSGSYQPDGGMDVIKAGMINLGKDYEYNKSKWGNYPNPGKHEGAVDDNVLMIYGSKPTSYSYQSTSVTVEPNKYYKLSFWVNTSATISGEVKEDGTPLENVDYGAYIKVSGGGISGEWIDIKTNGVWQKFEMYLEGDIYSSKTYNVTFGLGYGDKTDKHLTKGHAFFDDVVMEELKDIEGGKTAKQQYDEAPTLKIPADGDGSYIYKDSYRFSNASFTGYSKYSTSVPVAPLNWNSGYGGKDDDKASLNYNNGTEDVKATSRKGIVDLSNIEEIKTQIGFDKDDVVDIALRNSAVNKDDTSALMLYLDKPCSINYVSSSNITIEKGKIYRIGTWVKTLGGAKGTIILSNDNEEYRISFDSENYYVNGNSYTLTKESDGWAEIVFDIRGNNTHDVSYKMTLCLGTDGLSQMENWSSGHVFYDDITIQSVDIDADNSKTCLLTDWEMSNAQNHTSIDLNILNEQNTIVNGISNGNFITYKNKTINSKNYQIPDNFDVSSTEGSIDFFGTNKNNKIQVVDGRTADGVDLPFEVIYTFGTNPVLGTNVLKISSDENTTCTLKYNLNLTATMNKYYRLAFWVKTSDIEKGAGVSFYVNTLDKDGKVTATTSITDVNSANIDEKSGNTNGWQEVVFYLLGNSYQDTNYSIEIKYGRGNMLDGNDTLAKGTAYLYNINLNGIDQTGYSNAATNSLTKKIDFSSADAAETVTNGEFNRLDVANSTFNDNGQLSKLGTPSSWSIVNEKIPDDESIDLKAVKKGILDLNNIQEICTNESISDDVYKLIESKKAELMKYGGAYALAMYSENAAIYNYKSSSISLSANSFYRIQINVFTANGGKATVKLTSSSPHEESIDAFSMVTSTDGWTSYVFFIKTGLNSASVNLVVSLGDLDSYLSDSSTGKSSGLVMFDSAYFETVPDEKTYKAMMAEETHSKLEMSFNTDGFATSSYDKEKLNTINGWNSNAISSAPDILGKDSTLSGILDLFKYNTETIWEYPRNDEETVEALRAIREDMIRQVKDPINGYLESSFGNSVLMIDNLIPTGYKVVNSSSKDLAADKYYKISIWIYAFIEPNEENNGLTLSLKINDRDQDTVKISNIQSTNGWKEYSFYVKNVNDIKDTTLNSYLTLQLGSRKTEGDKDIPQYVQGTVFADNFKIETITEEEYTTAKEQAITDSTKATIEYVPDKNINGGGDKEDEKPANAVDWKMLAWAIPTIILAVILIAVLIVFLYKKYANPKQRTKFKGSKPVKSKKAEIKKKDNFDKFND